MINIANKQYCNSNITNARSSECINWCLKNSTECTLLNTINDCIKYNICDSMQNCNTDKCTTQKIENVIDQCKKYGIRTPQGLNLVACSEQSIKNLEKECVENDIDLSFCTYPYLQDIKTLKYQEKNKNDMDTNIQNTRSSLDYSMNVKENDNPIKLDNNILYLIIGFILFMLFMIFIFLFLLKNA